MNSDYDKDKEAKRELFELKKSDLNNDDLDSSIEVNPRIKSSEMGFFEKISYYRWPISVVGISIVIFTMFIVGLLNRPKYDISIIVAGAYPAVEYFDQIEAAFKSEAYDYNNDGKVLVNIVPFIIFDGLTTENPQSNSVNMSKLSVNITMSDVLIYLVDDYVYNIIDQYKIFLDLSKEYPDNKNISGSRFYLKDTNFSKELDLPGLPDDFSLIVRSFDKLYEEGNTKILEYYNYNRKIMDNIISLD